MSKSTDPNVENLLNRTRLGNRDYFRNMNVDVDADDNFKKLYNEYDAVKKEQPDQREELQKLRRALLASFKKGDIVDVEDFYNRIKNVRGPVFLTPYVKVIKISGLENGEEYGIYIQFLRPAGKYQPMRTIVKPEDTKRIITAKELGQVKNDAAIISLINLTKEKKEGATVGMTGVAASG